MSYTPFEHAESLCIGTVDFVAPDEIKVVLDIEAPESVALNSGGPRPFPRVNGYMLIPVDDGYLVGQVEWLTVERSPFPKRQGLKDFGLIDLPYPLRKMSLNPLGTLKKKQSAGQEYVFTRGVEAFPSIGAIAVLPTDLQLQAIVASGERRRVKIGTSPLAGNAEVRVDPDRLFGRHLAVLGNTGSGKSCSVAGLIRWSLEQAQAETKQVPNARFIILDPNGEYHRAFSDSVCSSKARIFTVNPTNEDYLLRVPIWFWNSAEWCSFTQASTRAQRPTLIQALRAVRDGIIEPFENQSYDIRRFLRTILATIRIEKNSGSPWGSFPRPKAFYDKLMKWKASLEPDLQTLENEQLNCIAELLNLLESFYNARQVRYPVYEFTRQEVDKLIEVTSKAHSAFGGSESDTEQLDVDAPRAFSGDSLLRSVEAIAEMLNISEHVETLLIRIRTLLSDARMKPIISDSDGISLEGWLENYIGASEASNGCVCVIDLSLIPTDIIHVEASVIARIVFEALQRYRHLNGATLPTVLVMEEAHTFIRRYKEDPENHDSSAVCCQVFERIAREGRKFGLGLVLSSQRPSELSQTVLSQCNSFLLHRISNDQDQELVKRLVPDNLKGLLRELPSLPSQNAILLGWASELPVLVRMNDLPKSQQPHSDDPDFWDVWTGKDKDGYSVQRKVDWGSIARDWQGIDEQATQKEDTP